MTEEQPPTAHEGESTSDIHDGLHATTKFAEDRKAASALASLNAAGNEETANNKQVDSDAVSKAMKSLGGSKATFTPTRAPSGTIKFDDADVTLLVDQLELPKVKVTELLKAHDGDVIKAMRAWVKP